MNHVSKTQVEESVRKIRFEVKKYDDLFQSNSILACHILGLETLEQESNSSNVLMYGWRVLQKAADGFKAASEYKVVRDAVRDLAELFYAESEKLNPNV